MLRSKATLLATTAALAAIISGGAAAASADSGATGATGTTGTTGTTGATGATATIVVNGAGFDTVDASTPTATMQTDYLGALESALTDAHTKAAALAAAVGDTLGAAQNITEQSNDSNGCSGGPMVFARGSAPTPAVAGPTSKKSHHHSKTRKTTAQIADVATSSTCTIEADVTVTYAMSPS
jgi:uncharacterized protein YggE